MTIEMTARELAAYLKSMDGKEFDIEVDLSEINGIDERMQEDER